MSTTCTELGFACARRPEVDGACKAVLADALDAMQTVEMADAVLLAGSLAHGGACGTVDGGAPLLLSDVDLVVVPKAGAGDELRSRLGRLSERVTRSGRRHGLVSHVEFGLLSTRALTRPRNQLFLHDLARSGRTLAGNPDPLRDLRDKLAGRDVDPEEGRRLALNRIAGQVYMLPWFAATDAKLRLVARYHFAKVYADHETALRVTHGAYGEEPFRHPVLDAQAEAAERWASFRRDPPLDPGTPAELLAEWKTAMRDQLSVAAALGPGPNRRSKPRPRLADALAWRRFPVEGQKGQNCFRPALRERLGLAGSPLAAAHARCTALARALLDGEADPGTWAERAGQAVCHWRLAVNGTDDTPDNYLETVAGLIRSAS